MEDVASAWRQKNFELILTADGSPSLKPHEGFEMMHHRGGAYAESQLIYGEVMREAFDRGASHFLSVGLGLGYNELIFASEALFASTKTPLKAKIHLRSFETQEVLKKELLEFLEAGGRPQNSRQQVYLEILNALPNGALVPTYLWSLYKSGQWQMDGALDHQTSYSDRYQVILFDAYSTKTSPEIWDEAFLIEFLAHTSDSNYCLFTTYACTGALKRALKNSGFTVHLREGFQGKRNSTLGRKES